MKNQRFLALALVLILLLAGCGAEVPVNTTEASEPATTAETQVVETTEPIRIPDLEQLDYESFHDLSAEDQQAILESFTDIEAFFVWYNQIKAEYEAAHPAIEIGDGVVDMGDLMD